MSKNINISDSELVVLQELWRTPQLTARELTDKLMLQTDWSEPTIKTLLLRLLRKNAVKRSKKDKVFIYTALVSKDEYSFMASRSLLDRLFNGLTADFLTCLVKNNSLSSQEINSLKELLDKADKK